MRQQTIFFFHVDTTGSLLTVQYSSTLGDDDLVKGLHSWLSQRIVIPSQCVLLPCLVYSGTPRFSLCPRSSSLPTELHIKNTLLCASLLPLVHYFDTSYDCSWKEARTARGTSVRLGCHRSPVARWFLFDCTLPYGNSVKGCLHIPYLHCHALVRITPVARSVDVSVLSSPCLPAVHFHMLDLLSVSQISLSFSIICVPSLSEIVRFTFTHWLLTTPGLSVMSYAESVAWFFPSHIINAGCVVICPLVVSILEFIT